MAESFTAAEDESLVASFNDLAIEKSSIPATWDDQNLISADLTTDHTTMMRRRAPQRPRSWLLVPPASEHPPGGPPGDRPTNGEYR